MDITFQGNQQKFNYRVCGMMIHDGKILAMQDERSPYFYLPGGRVKLGETAEEAVIRELREELGITPKIFRPLWLCQSFFREEVDRFHYHELCIYFLMDMGDTELLEKGEHFTIKEGVHSHVFTWLAFEELEKAYFYPLFLKKEIFHLPDHFTMRTEIE